MQARQPEIRIRPIADADWHGLEPLWLSLYEHQRAHGMLVELPPDAYDLWVASFKSALGRFAFVFVAEEEETLVGFLAGRIRAHPPHFGGRQVGFLSELFTDVAYRNRGIAKELIARARSWFGERGIDRLELPVVAHNSEARNFYLRKGWVEELTQMIWQKSSGKGQSE